MGNYLTREEFKTRINLEGTTYSDADIDRSLGAAEEIIEEMCNDRFYQSGTAVARTFDAETQRVLKLRPSAGSITSVKLDEDGDGVYEITLAASDYVKWPYNAAADSKPWWELRIHPNSDYVFPTSYPQAIEVTGLFGWATTPDAIKDATAILASKLLKRREAPFGIVAFNFEGGDAMRIARNDPDVMALVGPYMRDRISVA